MIEGALILVVGVAIGAVGSRLLGRRKSASVVPRCGCGHSIAFHDPQTRRCHARVGYERCACRRYSGPEPLPSFYAPQIAPDVDRDEP
jgi:hypothetical protein